MGVWEPLSSGRAESALACWAIPSALLSHVCFCDWNLLYLAYFLSSSSLHRLFLKATYYLVVYIPHFLYSCLGGWGFLHILTIMNKTVVIMGHGNYFELLISLPLGTYSEVRLLNHVVILFLSLWGTSIFSIGTVLIYFSNCNAQEFLFSLF